MFCVRTDDAYVDVDGRLSAMPTGTDHYPLARFADRETAERVARTIDGAAVCLWPTY